MNLVSKRFSTFEFFYSLFSRPRASFRESIGSLLFVFSLSEVGTSAGLAMMKSILCSLNTLNAQNPQNPASYTIW